MNRDSKGERLLSALAKHPMCELTEAGANYVRQRFDPYHDKPVKAVGVPDQYNGHTISRIIKKSVPFTAVSGDGSSPTSPWDCHIFQTPILDPQETLATKSPTVGNKLTWDPSQNASKPYGGLMIVRSDTGSFVLPPPSASTNLLGQLSLTSEDLSNVMRVTAMGFEFIDSTAELYRQGVLTAYRQNEPMSETAFWQADGQPVLANSKAEIKMSGRVVKLPPATVNDAMNIPDTKQWKVAEGAYVSVDFNQEELPMINPEPVAFLLQEYSGDISPGQTGSGILNFSFDTSSPIVTPMPTSSPTFTLTEYTTPFQKFVPINQSGVILSGLNPLFSGVVNCIWYVECAPSGEDVELLTLCSQSPAYDPMAFKIIGALRFMEPICVKLRENYTGQWFFEGIRDVVKKVAPWLANAQVVGNQVIKWIDTAGTNDGMINPQSFVKGNVAAKVAKEKKPGKGKAVPKAPGPAPMKRAYAPQAPRVRAKAFPASVMARARKANSNNVTVNAGYLRNLEQRNRAATGRGYLSAQKRKKRRQ